VDHGKAEKFEAFLLFCNTGETGRDGHVGIRFPVSEDDAQLGERDDSLSRLVDDLFSETVPTPAPIVLVAVPSHSM
jgi:hypothetical protein